MCHEGGGRNKFGETLRCSATKAFDVSTQIFNPLLFRTHSGNGSGHHISYTNIVISDTYGEDSSLRCGWSFRNLRRQFESLRRAATNCRAATFATLLRDTRVILLKDMHKHGDFGEHVTNGGRLVEASNNGKKILRRTSRSSGPELLDGCLRICNGLAKRLTNLPPIWYPPYFT